MLSRVAERLYWCARYLERAENTARLVRTYLQLSLDLPAKAQPGWGLVTEVLGAEEGFSKRRRALNEKNVLPFVTLSTEHPVSIASTIGMARENLRTTREIVPSEAWERVNALHLYVRRRASSGTSGGRYRMLSEVVQRCQQITGLLSGTMNHGDGYQFLRIGRNLERADMTSRILDVGSAHVLGGKVEQAPYEYILWMSVLKSLSAYQMYRQHVRRRVRATQVLAFLLKAVEFPRSIAHTLEEVRASLMRLPNPAPALKAMADVESRLEQADTDELRGERLRQFIDELQQDLARIHTQCDRIWFHPNA
ncbi:MAG: alpha-E domain-containing protein [Gammaproteobacteria bacterium]|nr:alpha-E domain-containing protein [Gammaproteobacteria bacterium]